MSRQCPFCPEEFYSLSSLKEHVWTIHKVPFQRKSLIFTCKVCDATFKWKSNMTAHSRIHQDISLKYSISKDGDQEHVCGFQGCTFSCRSKKVLIKHKHVCQKGKRPFICNKCDKTFAKNKDMQQHKGRMHRSQAFKCLGDDNSSGCGKDFKRKDGMMQHMRVCGNPPHKTWDQLSATQKVRRARAEFERSKGETQNYINY